MTSKLIAFLAALALARLALLTSSVPADLRASSAVPAFFPDGGPGAPTPDLSETLRRLERTLQTARDAHDVPGEAQAVADRARALEQAGRIPDAIAAWRAAVIAGERAGDGPGQVEALAAAARLLAAERPQEAEALLSQSIARARSETRRPLVAMAMLNLAGGANYDRGQWPQARALWEAVLAMQEKRAPNSREVVRSLRNLGEVADSQGDLIGARAYYQRALAIDEKLSPNSFDVADSLNNVGIEANQQGDLAGAREYGRRALAIYEKLAPNSLDVAGSLNNLGIVADHQGDLTAAKAYYQRALAIKEKLAPNSLDVAKSLNNLGTVARQQGDPVGAREYHQRALALRQKLAPNSLDVARSLDNLGVVASLQGDLSGAKDYYQRALAIKVKLAPSSLDVAGSLHNLGIVAYCQGNLTEARAYYRQALAMREKLSPNSLESAASLNGLALVAQKQAQWSEAEHQARRAWEIVRRQASAVSGDEARQSFGVSTASYASTLIQAQLALHQPGLAFLTLEQSRAQALQGAKRLLISPDGPLWEVPLAALVTNEQGAPHYLGKQTAITYTQSLTLFAQSRRDRPQLAKGGKPYALVLGDPLFDRQRTQVAAVPSEVAGARGERAALFLDGKPPAPLPGTKAEAIAIARLYGSAPLLGEQATEAALRQRIGKADVIHLATHGYLHPVRPMSSGLLLTVPEKEPEPGDTRNDGVLQAWEIYSQLKLKAELVVLSACETGRGQNVQGEGIVGLTRALQYAGARSIVASQWPVADASTTTLMVAFHTKLREGLAKDEALRQAMTLVRRNPATAHPYYWAAFVLTGDPDSPSLGGRSDARMP